VPLIAVAVLVVLGVIALIPFSMVQRFRAGTAQRTARAWVASLNIVAVAFSVMLFLGGAFITSQWVPEAMTYSLAGLALGLALGAIGVALTHWEYREGRWRYTPNRWLVTAITVVVAARVLYGFWRSWETWKTLGSLTEATASGLSMSMSAGSVVLGYYLVFWAGIRWQIGRSR
jgi:hypothetical protein